MRKFRRAAVLAAVAASAAAVAPASAAVGGVAGVGVGVMIKANSVGVPLMAINKMAIDIDCEAVGRGPFSSVAVTSCYTSIGLSAPSQSFPGAVAATANAGVFDLQPYQLCAAGFGVTVGGSIYRVPLTCVGDAAGSAVLVASS